MITGFCVVIVIFLLSLGFLFKVKSVVKKMDYVIFGVIFSCSILGLVGIEKNNWMEPMKSNYTKSYETYGFAYSILNSIYPYLTSEEITYDSEEVTQLLDSLSVQESTSRVSSDEETPYNLIVVQLESFMILY